MAFFNKIVPVRQSWTWPEESIEKLETNSLTDVEGTIVLNYDNISQVDTGTTTIFKVTIPFVPDTQYVKTGSNLNSGTQFTLNNGILSTGQVQLDFKFNTVVLGVVTGDFYLVSITINSIIKIDFLVKIVDVEV